MTFEEARQKHLAEFDSAVAHLRKVVSDPTWCNIMCKGYTEAFEKLKDSMTRIERLNDAEQTANK